MSLYNSQGRRKPKILSDFMRKPIPTGITAERNLWVSCMMKSVRMRQR